MPLEASSSNDILKFCPDFIGNHFLKSNKKHGNKKAIENQQVQTERLDVSLVGIRLVKETRLSLKNRPGNPGGFYLSAGAAFEMNNRSSHCYNKGTSDGVLVILTSLTFMVVFILSEDVFNPG